MNSIIEKERINVIKKYDNNNKDYILYWMQSSQRISYNLALIYSIELALSNNLPLIVLFVITEKYPKAEYRHYDFMVEGLLELKKCFKEINVNFIIKKNNDITNPVIDLSRNAKYLICDKGYLKYHKMNYDILKKYVNTTIIQIEDNVLIPIEKVSYKEEYSAATIRRKITPLLEKFIVRKNFPNKTPKNLELKTNILDFNNKKDFFKILNIKLEDRLLSKNFIGGYSNAINVLKDFINHKIQYYSKRRNDPSLDFTSNLSPYIHFGNISPLEIILNINHLKKEIKEVFIEELIVRRELAINFVNYNENYDNINSINRWSYETLKNHEKDKREYIYSLDELENFKTHDIYWNSAQKEMIYTGKMHNYMRMYWGKKIIEWTISPNEAYNICIYLNDKYELDGRDPNGYAGVSWCFGKHDRAWKERAIFGKIRYMNDKGLERKYDIKKYVEKINNII